MAKRAIVWILRGVDDLVFGLLLLCLCAMMLILGEDGWE